MRVGQAPLSDETFAMIAVGWQLVVVVVLLFFFFHCGVRGIDSVRRWCGWAKGPAESVLGLI